MTILNKFGMAALIAAAVSMGVGCGADCVDICEKGKECSEGAGEVDCDAICEKRDSAVESAGCEDQADDYYSCADEGECGAADCAEEFAAVGTCMNDYCKDNASECASIGLVSTGGGDGGDGGDGGSTDPSTFTCTQAGTKNFYNDWISVPDCKTYWDTLTACYPAANLSTYSSGFCFAEATEITDQIKTAWGTGCKQANDSIAAGCNK